MKNKDLIEYIVVFSVVAILFYRKYGKRFLEQRKNRGNIQQKESSGPHATDDEYEPYSSKGK